ncbi:MAG: universal stress protein [Candidatus Tumulicola sp.]
MIRNVLVATDGSEASMAAVRTAVELTASLGGEGRLHVAAVVDYAGVPGVFAKQPPAAPDLLSEEASTALELAGQILAEAAVPAERHLLHGEVVEALLRCAAENAVDILVAGFHGRNRLARLVMGSVVGKLVRSTHLPVVVVRAADA